MCETIRGQQCRSFMHRRHVAALTPFALSSFCYPGECFVYYGSADSELNPAFRGPFGVDEEHAAQLEPFASRGGASLSSAERSAVASEHFKSSEALLAAIVTKASGPSGPNIEYVENLLRSVKELSGGTLDPHLARLQAAVAEAQK